MSFGSFDYICLQSSLVLCPALQEREPTCFARNISISSLLLFQPSVLVINTIGLLMTCIMISSIKFKYTAVGRKEISLFFYIYASILVTEILLITGIIPLSSQIYLYGTALHTSLVVNGFVPFQIIEDGTRLSVWSLRITTFVVGIVCFIISIMTFQNGLDKVSMILTPRLLSKP
jgi:Chitin synthase export chaperone